ncbi:Hypothetical predicted protein [Paramuricea clavata]|uniref:Uncharacterized protein n=1 Tax=Paramuricea clavata TaxID=317549 RepID=A0A6S7JA47_PARCT|nr:Hypothetical predicted protein [Paramuricea clavata]
MLSGSPVSVPLTNDILCKAYDGAKTQQQGKSHPKKLKSSSSEAPVGNYSSDQDASNRDPEEMVEATIKFDGSLGIAFLWKDEVMVTSGHKLDSDQAMWAKQWIKDHCHLTEFQAGYTYLFEIIFLNNTVVVNYPFEGLVLLAITDESGHELPYEEVLDCARTIGFFMVTPRITGSYSEVLWYCGGIEHSEESVTPNWPPFTSGALPVNKKRQEGWIVRFNDGSRQKIVCRWWKNASSLGHLVHPQVIWLLLKHDKIKYVFRNAPKHCQVEIRRMVQAIRRKFEETLQLAERCLQKPECVYSTCNDDEWWGKVAKINDFRQTKNSRYQQKRVRETMIVCANFLTSLNLIVMHVVVRHRPNS